MDIRNIILKSAFIEERCWGAAYEAQASARSDNRFQEWEKLLNVAEDNGIFSKRLRFDGISKEEALAICGECASFGKNKLPRWAEIITEVIKLLPIAEDDAERGTSLRRKDIELTGPVLSLFPFVMYCESRWKECLSGITAAGHADGLPMGDFSRMALNRLYQAAWQVFNTRARFMTLMGHKADDSLWDNIEKELLSGGWPGLFEEYPVLAKRMGTVIEQYLDFIEEFFLRFREKREILEKEFFKGGRIGRIVKLEGEISDLHQNGRCVLVLTFDGNRKLVYKPRSLEIDVSWEKFVKGFPAAANLIRTPHAVNFGKYGFVEYIRHEPCAGMDGIKTYFYNAGGLTALLYAFGGNDFHRENIIAAGNRPVIIDTETLMIPVARPFEQGGKDKPDNTGAGSRNRTLKDMMETSVINLGMLPLFQAAGIKGMNDIGALTGASDEWDNLPVFDGRKYSAVQFPEQTAEGFRYMYLQIMKNRKELLEGENGVGLFAGCRFRMLIRTSQVYANVIKHINRSVTLKDGFDYSLQAERMVNAFLYTAADEIIPGLLKVFKSEKNTLQNGCIPIFYGEPDGEGIMDDKGLLFQNYFSRNALENAEECIKNMDEDDLEIQLQIIVKSLTAERGDIHRPNRKDTEASEYIGAKESVTDEELIQEAEAIYKSIMDGRIKAADGEYSWLTVQYDIKSGVSRLGLMNPSLYDGLFGMAVFTGALYKITGKPEYKETADYCIDKTSGELEALLPVLERYQVSLGYGSGIGGFLAGLEAAAEYTGSRKAAETAEKLLFGISEKSVFEDTGLDVLGGVSGLVIAVTSRGGLTGNTRKTDYVKQILRWCGEHLLEKRTETTKEGYRVWAGKDASQPLTGLGHGEAGIALALMRIYHVIGGTGYLEAAKEAVAYENAVFEQNYCNWPDFRIPAKGTAAADQTAKRRDRTEPGFMSGYCSGAPGIGLSRLGMITIVKDAEFQEALMRDIRRADRFVREFSHEIRDHLCCGRTAGIDFLAEEALTLGEKDAMDFAKVRMKAILEEKKRHGRYCLLSSDGRYAANTTLFQGTAGIAYEMLRLAAPGTIRSILI